MLARLELLAGVKECSYEREAIDEAVLVLRTLKKERLHF